MADPAVGVKTSPAQGTPPAETHPRETDEREARGPEPRGRRSPLPMLGLRVARAVGFRLRGFSRSRPLTFLAAVGVISFAAGAALRIWRSRRHG